MTYIKAILEIYVDCGKKAGALILKNWAVVFSFYAYGFILISLSAVAMVLGFLGGIIMVLTMAACISSFLYLIENIIKYRKVTFNDFKNSFGIYLWKANSVIFILWIISMVVGMLFGQILGPALSLIFTLLVLILFNVVPELIYQRHYSTGEMLGKSVSFMQEKWIEWIIPNFIFILIFNAISGTYSPIPSFYLVLNANLFSNFFHITVFIFAMIYRGLLFDILDNVSRRKLVFQSKFNK